MLLETHNDLPDQTRRAAIDFLNKRVADAIDLVYQAKQAHWNVKGIEFRSLHKLFDEVADEVAPFVDLLAERLSQLGGVVQGTVQAAAKNTSLQEYPLGLLDGRTHLQTLCERVSIFGKAIRKNIDLSAEHGDHATADILTEVVRAMEKVTWLLESHLTDLTASKRDAVEISPHQRQKVSTG